MIERIWALVQLELRSAWRRPLWWVLAMLLILLMWGFASDAVIISTGGSSAGAERPWGNSQFNLAYADILTFTLTYLFFVSVAFGNVVPDDEDLRVRQLLHGTRLTMGEYMLGRWLGVAAVVCVVMILHLLAQMAFGEWYPLPEAERRGPFALANYARVFALFITLPVLCVGAFTFAIGAITRQAVLVFLTPVILLLTCVFFLWRWSPEWLPAHMNQWLQVADPTGFRWLNETWIKDDRGAAFYNHTPVPLDGTILLNRAWQVLAGAGALALAVVVERRRLRRPFPVTTERTGEIIAAAAHAELSAPACRADEAAPPYPLGMTQRTPGWLSTMWAQARAEMRELRRSPGLWIFVPLITMQVAGTSFFVQGPFDTPLRLTPGTAAARSFNTVVLLSLFLLLFYTTESMARDDRRRVAPLLNCTGAGTSARLAGKMLANTGVVLLAVLAAVYAAVFLVITIQNLMSGGGPAIAPDPLPMVRVWVFFLLPTVVAWMGLIALVWALTRNRYAVYATGLGVLLLTGILHARDWMNWVGNWLLWNGARWSDFGSFELDRHALWLNRVLWLCVGMLLVQVAVMVTRRRTPDPVGVLGRVRWKPFLRHALRTLPLAIPAVVAAIALGQAVAAGRDGGQARRAAKLYHATHAETWRNFKDPCVGAMDLDVTLDPAAGSFRVEGEYELLNPHEAPMTRFALTPGAHFRDVHFTFEEVEYSEESAKRTHRDALAAPPVECSAGLWIFRPAAPLESGQRTRVRFRYHGSFPPGVGLNTRDASEFILPSGVVLNSFGTSFLPWVGWIDSIGVDPEDAVEPRRPDPDEWMQITKPGLGTGGAFDVTMRITLPEEYRANAPGVLDEDVVNDGMRTMTWRTDHPIRFCNIVAGRLVESRGEHSSIWHLPEHTRNVPAMLRALDGARTWYSQWFHPYPWRDLRLTEFPGLADYAQGFGTNIVFSESIGFLARPTSEQDAPFLVTAHEAAHQWWGNILMPGDGPGGNILSEGLAHYSTARLMEQLGCGRTGSDTPMSGEQARQAFLRGIEKTYVERRQADEERPMVAVDGTRQGDVTVTYDKGGWVFWMLYDLMGQEACDAGVREFITRFKDGPDYPLLQDFTAVLREHAPDQQAYDAFVQQWFHEVVLPEFKVEEARAERRGQEWVTRAVVSNVGTGSVRVTVAVTNGGVRWDAGPGNTPYADVRELVPLGAGESATLEFVTPWEPRMVVVDPDVRQLQLGRKQAQRPVRLTR